jgi:hypothetical protein
MSDLEAANIAMVAVTAAQANFMLELARSLVGLGVSAELLADRADALAKEAGQRSGLSNAGLSLNFVAERLRAEFGIKPRLSLVENSAE